MKITTFWVVAMPGPDSVLADICFETDAKGLARQFRGGLNEEDVHALYTERGEAEKEARRILAAFERQDAEAEQAGE